MLLKELSEAIGVSGDEGAVRKIILEAIKDHVTDIEIDAMGNLTAFKKGTGETPLRVMLAAHMDEIGFMVQAADSNGFLRFLKVGGVDDRILPGLRVKVGNKGLPGVILWAPIHLNHDQNTKSVTDLRIDIGASNKNGAEGMVKPGERIAFDSFYAQLSDKIVRGKAFDDRVGCSLLIDIIQGGDYPVDLIIAFTVQEEIGLRGARVAAQRLKPDVAIVLEGTTAHDLPDANPDPDNGAARNPATELGKGPAITVMDASMITPPQLVRLLRKVGDDNAIPYQLKSALGGGTDAGQIHQTNAGIPSAVISVPCRYIHAPTAFMNLDDYQNALALAQATLKSIKPETITPL